jgi:hypothetical protein
MFVGSWIDLLQRTANRRIADWTSVHSRSARLILIAIVLVVGSMLAYVSA